MLGSNLGHRRQNIIGAIDGLQKKGLRVLNRSRCYESEPWGFRSQPRFLNQLVEFDTKLPPKQLLKIIKNLEQRMGRVPSRKWGARKIDIDILFMTERKTNTEHLSIPHPLLDRRPFAYILLSQLDPNTFHRIKAMDRSKFWPIT